jgi:hypothetical protein
VWNSKIPQKSTLKYQKAGETSWLAEGDGLMSLINDALKRAKNAKLDKLPEGEPHTETPITAYNQSPSRKRSFGPLTMVCMLVIGGGLIAYRYIGPGDGPGPQIASAEPKTPPPPVVAPPAPSEPKIAPKPTEDKWVNPAFKNLTPQAANAMRAKVAESMVTQVVKPPKIEPPKPPAASPVRPVDPAAFKLHGVMFYGSDSRAVINGTVYRVGQKVSGAVVESINTKTVTLKAGAQEFKIGM